jgi:hypothetical protein
MKPLLSYQISLRIRVAGVDIVIHNMAGHKAMLSHLNTALDISPSIPSPRG